MQKVHQTTGTGNSPSKNAPNAEKYTQRYQTISTQSTQDGIKSTKLHTKRCTICSKYTQAYKVSTKFTPNDTKKKVQHAAQVSTRSTQHGIKKRMHNLQQVHSSVQSKHEVHPKRHKKEGATCRKYTPKKNAQSPHQTTHKSTHQTTHTIVHTNHKRT